MELNIVFLILLLHFLGDFILQSDKIALNKSSSNTVLLIHVTIYSSLFLIFGPVYALLNGALHFMTDWVTSRASSKGSGEPLSPQHPARCPR